MPMLRRGGPPGALWAAGRAAAADRAPLRARANGAEPLAASPVLTVPAAAGALVGLAAVAVLLVRAGGRHERREKPVWRPMAAGALVLWLGDVPAALGHPLPPGHPVAAVATTTGIALLLVGQVALARQHVVADAARGWSDLVSAPLLVLAGLSALLPVLPRLAGGPTGADALPVLVPVSVAVTAAALAAGSLVAGAATGSGRERRGRLVAAALLLLGATEAARPWLVAGGAVEPAAVAGGAALAHAGALAALALASRLPSGAPSAPRREGAAATLRGPVLLLLPAAALLGIDALVDRAGGLPAAAAVCALAVIVLQVAGLAVRARAVGGSTTRRGDLVDGLTGLGDRRALLAHLARTEHRSGPGRPAQRTVALALVDLDRFKAVNDALGHDAGDELLRQVGQRLREASREGDLLTRQGGDEFAVVLLGATAEQAARRAREVVLAVEVPFLVDGHRVSVDASVGVAAWPEHAGDAEQLLSAADAAMYRAKGVGGGVVVFDAAADRARRDAESLVADLRAAVAQDALTCAYQPQVRADGTLDGVEALVRWEHPVRGVLEPETFVPLAERHGLMPALTGQVLRRALALAADLAAGGASREPVRVSVNASATSLGDDSLVVAVTAALAGSAVPASALVVEITETQLVADPATARAVVDALVDLGVGISVDDYGTGYSSLAHLAGLPASELKLDRSLVAGAATDDRLAAIVSSTVTLAHDLGLRLVAEGVEDAATLERVRALGVDVTQGYLHAPPLSAADLLAWVARRQ